MSRTLIIIGLLLVAAGVLWPWLQKGVPGDIVIKRDGFAFYAPIATCIVISVALSLILWLLRR
jgi:Protein of unknown function (DUF2905)